MLLICRTEIEGRKEIQVLVQSLSDVDVAQFFGVEELRNSWDSQKQKLESEIQQSHEEEQRFYNAKKM